MYYGKINVLEIQVRCPQKNPAKLYNKFWIGFAKNNDGVTVNLPNNGCDNMSECDICERCRAAVDMMFFHKIGIETPNCIIPDMSLIKQDK